MFFLCACLSVYQGVGNKVHFIVCLCLCVHALLLHFLRAISGRDRKSRSRLGPCTPPFRGSSNTTVRSCACVRVRICAGDDRRRSYCGTIHKEMHTHANPLVSNRTGTNILQGLFQSRWLIFLVHSCVFYLR